MNQVVPPDDACAAAIAIDVVTDCDCNGEPLSLTLAVKVEELAVDGVPEMTPAEDSANPAGREPEVTDHAYVGVPPVACNDWL